MLQSTYVGHSFPRGQKHPKQQSPIIDPSKGFDTHFSSISIDPPLVDHPLVVSAANVSEEAAVETSMNLQKFSGVAVTCIPVCSFFIGHGVLYGTTPPKTLTDNMLRLVDKSSFMHALVAWIPVLFYETASTNMKLCYDELCMTWGRQTAQYSLRL